MRLGSTLLTACLATVSLAACASGPAMLADAAAEGPEVLGPVVEPWSFVVLPDTQYYNGPYAELYEAQTKWVRRARLERNIKFVLHVGDVTDHDSEVEWMHARMAMRELEPLPFAMAPGNHDYAENAWKRSSLFSMFFPTSIWEDQGTFGGSFEYADSANTVQFFETPEGPWLVLSLEFGPRPTVLDWANEVLKANAGIPAVVLTHAYLYSDGTRHDWHRRRSEQMWNPHEYGLASEPEGVTDGQQMFDELVEPRSDVALVVCGHVHNHGGAARLTDTRLDGTVVHQLLSDYQAEERGGNGWLRIVTVYPDRFDVETYSPVLDAFKNDAENQFSLPR